MEHLTNLRSFRLSDISHRRRAILSVQLGAIVGLVLLIRGALFAGLLTPVTQALEVVLIFITAHFLLSIVRILFVSSYRTRMQIAHDEHDNFTLALNSVVSVLSVIIGIASIFVVYEIDFLQVWASLALFSVAFAWIGKEYISNFIDSFILMFTTDYKIGEYIKISDEKKGIINDITFRATKIRTDEGDILFVPNTILLNEEVTNYSKTRWKRITIPFTSYRNTLQDLTTYEAELKKQLTHAFPDLVNSEKIYLRIKNITNDSVEMSLEVAVSSYSFKIEEDVKKWVSVYVLSTA